ITPRLTTTQLQRPPISEIELIFKESTSVLAALDRPSGMKRSSSVSPFPFFPIGIVLFKSTLSRRLAVSVACTSRSVYSQLIIPKAQLFHRFSLRVDWL